MEHEQMAGKPRKGSELWHDAGASKKDLWDQVALLLEYKFQLG